jgi:hypothetical protein
MCLLWYAQENAALHSKNVGGEAWFWSSSLWAVERRSAGLCHPIDTVFKTAGALLLYDVNSTHMGSMKYVVQFRYNSLIYDERSVLEENV